VGRQRRKRTLTRAVACSGVGGAPDTIRTCDLCLRRVGAFRKACAASKIRPIDRTAVLVAPPIALHSCRRTQDPCVIFGIDSSDHQSDGGAERSLIPRICSMAVVWTLNVSDAGTRRASSIEDRIWDGVRMSVSATVGRTLTLGQSQRSLQRVRTRGAWFGHDLKAPSLQRYFWVRNAPNALTRPRNHLITQQMRAPSERTINPRLAIFSGEGERQVCASQLLSCKE
jgi:hypothetical protein